MNKRIYGLDVLRAVAILLVIYSHSSQFLNFTLPAKRIDGVNIFFVLSGYLIGTIIIKSFSEKMSLLSLCSFWLMRWFRTLPAYFFILTILIALEPIHKSFHFIYYFFLQNISRGGLLFFPESWSLSVEEWFYLIIPCALYLLKKTNMNFKKNFILLITIVLIAEFLSKIVKAYTFHYSVFDEFDYNIRQAVSLRLDSICFGLLAAYYNFFYPTAFSRFKTTFFSVGLLLWITIFIFYLSNLFFWQAELAILYLENIATLLLLPHLVNLKTGKGLIFKGFTFISITSYSMYLINYSIYHYTRHFFWHVTRKILSGVHAFFLLKEKNFQWIEMIWYLFFTIAGGYLLNRLIERPFMKLRRKLNFSQGNA